jgi:hypothetical protein
MFSGWRGGKKDDKKAPQWREDSQQTSKNLCQSLRSGMERGAASWSRRAGVGMVMLWIALEK